MPNFKLYSAADIGLSDTFANFFASPTSTVAASVSHDALEMSDNDLVFENEGAGSDQFLTADLYVDGVLAGEIGDTVLNLGQSTVTNATTGEVGYLVVVQVNGVAIGYASTIELNPGDNLSMTPWISTPNSIDYNELEPSCFARGTEILTQHGNELIETLEVGQQVWTRDHGFQEIRWIGSQKCSGLGRLEPIFIQKNALGNTRDLIVSPMHRVLISGWRASILFGQAEVLAHAADLVNDTNILRQPTPEIQYFHLLFDRHEIIYSNGCLTESFHPDDANVSAFDAKTQGELINIFPQLNKNGKNWPHARQTLNAGETKLLQTV